MAVFDYEALDPRFKKVKGRVEAENSNLAAGRLREKGLTITVLAEKNAGRQPAATLPRGSSFAAPAGFISGFSRVKGQDVISLLKQLASLIAAGVSVVPALEILQNQTKKKKVKNVLTTVRADVEGGEPLSDAMEKHPRVFKKMVTSLLRAGEATGLLDNAIRQAADYLNRKAELKKQVMSGFIYPVIVILLTITVVIFLVVFVIPQIVPLLEMNGADLPWNTQLLIDITEYLKNNYAGLLARVIPVIMLFVVVYHTKAGRYAIDRYKLKLPLFGEIFQYSAVIQFSRTMALMLSSGVSIIDSLQSTSETIGNQAVQKTVAEMSDDILAGQPLSEPIRKAGAMFPPMVESLVKVGEETGGIDTALFNIAEMLDEMLRGKVKVLNAMMEPFLILVMAGMVGFVAWALIGGMLAGYGA